MTTCNFCKTIKANSSDSFIIPGITKFTFIYDIFPVVPGHTLIIPNRHVSEYLGLTKPERNELNDAIIALYKHLAEVNFEDLYSTLLRDFNNNKNAEKFLQDAKEKAIQYNRSPDGYNHGLNDCLEAGRTVEHLHYHIMPRWAGDSDDPRGGVRHMFLGKGNYHK
ncbi:MAG: HIT domain-containing protein [Candidatus Saccharibacteria bacterium]|nr:HIT domain-containing protein [Candidatus Saccharibacteria bacterium]